MQIIRDISTLRPEPSIATIGFFDGVHTGHRYLIRQVKEIGRQRFTFCISDFSGTSPQGDERRLSS